MSSDPAPFIDVTVLLFAAYRETLGTRRLTLQVPDGTTVSGIFSMLARDAPGLCALRPYTTFAVNRRVCSPDGILSDGDEVAFLQPASGGFHD